MRYVVAGTGRSGTAWASRVLTLWGLRCGHEAVFDHDPVRTAARLAVHLDDPPFYGDASLAVGGYLDLVNRTPLLHLVRDPLLVVRSFLGDDFFAQLTSPYTAFMAAHLPELAETEDQLGRAIRYVSGWTERIMAGTKGPYRLVRLEDLASDRELLSDLVLWMGFVPPTDRPMLDAVNAHAPADLPWEDVDSHPDGWRLRLVAERTGYA